MLPNSAIALLLLIDWCLAVIDLSPCDQCVCARIPEVELVAQRAHPQFGGRGLLGGLRAGLGGVRLRAARRGLELADCLLGRVQL